MASVSDSTPVSNQYFLASGWGKPTDVKIGIYVVDIEKRVSLIHEQESVAFLEPIPLVARDVPPVVPEKVDLAKSDATIYIQDIHAGPGLTGVPRGTVKRIRVIAYDDA